MLTTILKNQKPKTKKSELNPTDFFGIVLSSRDTIAQVFGLSSVTSGELISDFSGNLGLVLNLEYSLTGVVMFSEDSLVAGDLVVRLFRVLSTMVNPLILGNIFTPLGSFLNNVNYLDENSSEDILVELGKIIRAVDLKAPGIIFRQPVYEPLFTGFMGIDGLLPLGQGQRELIIGDRQTGKTAIAIDAVLNQSNIDIFVDKYLP